MTDYTDRLFAMFAAQEQLQREAYGIDIPNMPLDERVKFFKDMTLALTDELHEALAETSWKPWQTADYFNGGEVRGELVDAFHFLMNLWLAASPGMSVDEAVNALWTGYREKNERNAVRQQVGYDGVSTKCPNCKRELDKPDAMRGIGQMLMGGFIGYECGHCAQLVPDHIVEAVRAVLSKT